MGFRNAAQQEAAIEAARMQQAKKDCIDAVYASRQDFVRCEANNRAIIETIVYWTGNPDVLPTKFIFDEALLENPAEINNFARQPVERSRQQVIEEILELLAAHSRRDEFMLKSEESRMKHMSIDALRIRLAELKTEIDMASTPVAVLKVFVADARTVKTRYPNYPDLPESIVRPGTVRAVPLDTAYIKALNSFELKKLVRLFSAEQVNARLRGED